MIKTTAIKLVHPETMMVTWDIGRRCNYDCTYCESTRHNNISKHRSKNEMISVLKFIDEYSKIYNQDSVNINFTGGEPTSNPIFFDFIDYVKSTTNFGLGLTTNGTFNSKFLNVIEKNFNWITVSYHAEANPMLKDKVMKNIKLLSEKNIKLNVNVMMHTDYWDECVQVCETLKNLKIKFNPRPIGDGNITIKGWFQDADGSNRRTSHEYSDSQQKWYLTFMGSSEQESNNKKQGTELGRNCCGGRCIEGKVEGQWTPVKLVDTNFKGWYCSVNRYFLHIDHETETVYHHQTCQAKFNNTRGPIGSLKNIEEIFDYARSNLKNIIVCPNNRCGCGMCVPKAKNIDMFNEII